jgi:hypothetical protein
MMTLTGGRKTTITAHPAPAHNAHLFGGHPGC